MRRAAARARPAARGTARGVRTGARRRRRSPRPGGSRRSRRECGGRCGRAGRCAARPSTAATAGRRARDDRQNSKLRPSPPASVEISMLGPSAARKRATSVSRRAVDNSSWKTPVASCARALSAWRSISSVSRWATKTSVFSFARRQRAGLRQQPLEAGVARVAAVRLLLQGEFVRPQHRLERRAGRERAANPVERAPPRDRVAAHVEAPAVDRGCGEAHGRIPRRRSVDRHRHARRQAADIDAARRAGARRQRHARREPRLEVDVLRKLVRPQQLQQPEEPVRVVFERRRAEQEHVPAERRDRRNRAIGRLARVAAAAAAAAALRRRPAGRCPPRPPGRRARGRSTSVSSAITARR